MRERDGGRTAMCKGVFERESFESKTTPDSQFVRTIIFRSCACSGTITIIIVIIVRRRTQAEHLKHGPGHDGDKGDDE
eukprot:2002290-Rhodomonas_salina.1